MPSADAERIRAELVQQRSDAEVSIENGRRGWEEAAAQTNAGLRCAVTPLDLDGQPAEWISSPDSTDAGRVDSIVLLLHGGGFTAGSPRTHRELALRIAEACGCAVLLPDYRLAPEHPCPAAVKDAVAAYRWALAHRHPPERIALVGDSAGASIALAALVAIRDAGAPLPGAAVLLSPWVDLTLSGRSYVDNAALDPLTRRADLSRAVAHYLAGRPPSDPVASPIFAQLHGLPPLLIHVGDLEILLSDAVDLAAKARAAGVEVRLTVWEGMWHVFAAWAAHVPEAQESLTEVGTFVRSMTAGRSAHQPAHSITLQRVSTTLPYVAQYRESPNSGECRAP